MTAGNLDVKRTSIERVRKSERVQPRVRERFRMGKGFATAELLALYDRVFQTCVAFMSKRGITMAHPPGIFTVPSCPASPGSDDRPVELIIGGERRFLTDSAQFHLEMACRTLSRDAYSYGACFRDEHLDIRHLPCFYHLEVELIGTRQSAIDFAEELLKDVVRAVLESDCAILVKRTSAVHQKTLANLQFCRITFEDALNQVGREGCELHASGARRLSHQGEMTLLQQMRGPIWVVDSDPLAAPFFQALDRVTDKALTADLLAGLGEVAGLGQRHTTEQELLAAMRGHAINEEPYSFYLAMRRSGDITTSGFGIGMERLVAWILEANDISAVTISPT